MVSTLYPTDQGMPTFGGYPAPIYPNMPLGINRCESLFTRLEKQMDFLGLQFYWLEIQFIAFLH
jgi:hypothetical protein